MAHRLSLVHHFGVRLIVRSSAAARTVRTAHVQHELRETQITRIASGAIELR